MITKATDYSNLYRAKVVSNYDPKELCRIKARIPCIHGVSEIDGVSDDAIPYASPCFLDASFDSGTFLVPEVGSTVFVFFESGESTKPIYFGSSVSYQYEDEAQYLGDKNSYNFQGTDGKRMKRAGFGDTPFNVYKKGILRKLILFKSRKGSSIEFCDEDENEHISIYDRVGQVLTMYSPIKIRDNDYGFSNRGVFSMLKQTFNIEDKALMIWKAVSSSFLRFVSDVSYTKNEFITVYNDDKAGISVDIGKDNRLLIFYKDETLIEVKEDGIKIKTNKIDIDSESVNIKGDLKVQGQVLSSSTIRGNVYGTWVHSSAQYPASVSVNVDIQSYEDDKDEEIVQE